MGKKPHRRLDHTFSKDSDWTERKHWESRANVENWFGASLRHFTSMKFHHDEMERYQPYKRNIGDTFQRDLFLYQSHQTNLYHFMSLGFENLLKGVIVVRNGGKMNLVSKNNQEDYGKFEYPWNKWKNKHCLVKLAEHADIGLSQKEIDALDWYTDFITWKGRYPLPQNTLNQVSATVGYMNIYGLQDRLRLFFNIGKAVSHDLYKKFWDELLSWLDSHCEKISSQTK